MTTGDRIKQARLQAGMTQSELAEKIGVKFSAIHKYVQSPIKCCALVTHKYQKKKPP